MAKKSMMRLMERAVRREITFRIRTARGGSRQKMMIVMKVK